MGMGTFNSNISDKVILSNATVTGAGESTWAYSGGRCTYQAYGTTSGGTGSATIDIEGSSNDTTWITLGTIGLTLGTAETSDAFTTNAPFTKVRANVTSIAGTGATVSVTMAS